MKRFQALCTVAITAATTLAGHAYAQPAPPAPSQLQAPAPAKPAAWLKLDGIAGESTQVGHQGWIELLSVSFGPTGAQTASGASGAGGGKIKLGELVVTKAVDKASPLLLRFAGSAETIKTVTLELRKPSSSTFLQVTLSDVKVTRRLLSAGGDRPSESLSLSFSKVETRIATPKSDGTVELKAPDGTFDLGREVRL